MTVPISAARLGSVAATLLVFACNETREPQPEFGTETHWLMRCDSDAECGELTCECGVCTLVCEDDAQCPMTEAMCARRESGELQVQCGGRALPASGLCLEQTTADVTADAATSSPSLDAGTDVANEDEPESDASASGSLPNSEDAGMNNTPQEAMSDPVNDNDDAGASEGSAESGLVDAGEDGAAQISPLENPPADPMLLLGDWEARGNIGNCIDEYVFYNFAEAGQYSHQVIDDNACEGPRLLERAEGPFQAPGDGSLTLSWQVTGSSVDLSESSTHNRSWNYAWTDSPLRGEGIVIDVLLPVDGQRWHRSNLDQTLDASGLLVEELHLSADYEFSDVPLETGAAGCEMTVTASVEEFNRAESIDRSYSAEILTVPCTLDEVDDVQRLRYAGFSGNDALDDVNVWSDYLASIDFEGTHPEWARPHLQSLTRPTLYRLIGRADYFADQSIPTWTRSAGPPEIPDAE